jgi:tetratricopeptide (TPR) repeat protein
VYRKQGKYEEALYNYEKALEIRENALGKEHISTAKIYNNISLVYYKQGKKDEALQELEKTLKIQEKALGKNHPSTKSTQKNIDYLKRDMTKQP